jgi:hypothetical protein
MLAEFHISLPDALSNELEVSKLRQLLQDEKDANGTLRGEVCALWWTCVILFLGLGAIGSWKWIK